MKRIKITDRQKETFETVLKYTLFTLIGAGIIIAVATSPFALTKIVDRILKKYPKAKREDVEKSINKIFKDKMAQVVEKNGKCVVRITQKGKKKVVDLNIDAIKVQRQKWDGMWRLVFFDIPETLRHGRRVLRDKLKEIGFVRLQKSVWVCPYECQDEIDFITAVYGLEKYVNYAVCESGDFTQSMQKIFEV